MSRIYSKGFQKDLVFFVFACFCLFLLDFRRLNGGIFAGDMSKVL